jgi:predicted Zn-dependent protease
MLGREYLQKLCEDVLSLVGDDDAEVSIFTKNESLTRFANNNIHQNVGEKDILIGVRIFLGSQEGTASTNRVTPDALEEIVARARAAAVVSPEDPEFPGLSGPANYDIVQAFDEVTAEFSPQERAKAVAEVCQLADSKNQNAFGAFTTGVSEIVLANTEGMFAYHMTTDADFQTVVMEKEGDASGWAQRSGWKVEDIPAAALGAEAIFKTEMNRKPRLIAPGEYPVVLDPYATQDIMMMLNMTGMGANTVQEGRSWMNDRIGSQVFSPSISIWDDALDPNGIPIPFDFEGTPKQRVDIVREGVVMGPVYDRRTANKEDKVSTGHALPPNSRGFSPLAINLFMAPGDTELEEMIRTTHRGLYITRFHYTRPVHPANCVITGMTRDGVYWIEDGKIQYPVKNLRFTQSYVEALADVDAVGKDTRLLTFRGLVTTRVPPLKLSHFNFTGSTV